MISTSFIRRSVHFSASALCAVVLSWSGAVLAQGVMNLPAPEKTGGKPLMEALAERHAARDFSDKVISEQTLSDLLWATWGINRPDGHRTAPTARNKQEVEVYVVMASGVWRYDAKDNTLVKELDEDYRAQFDNAPLSFVYAAPDGRYDPLHVGALFQNAGLYSASVGLNNVVRGDNYIPVLQGKLALPEGYKIYITQSFGWPPQ
ncbi:MAG: hypothetical protein MESAZ_02450 [Saezia sanguinis]